MGVVCLFLNFVPLCKFLFEQQFLCNTNLLYCVTLLSVCVFQRSGAVGGRVRSHLFFLNNYCSCCSRPHHLCAFPIQDSSCPESQSTYCLCMTGHVNPANFLLCQYLPHTFHLPPGPYSCHPKPCSTAPVTALPASSHLCHCAKWTNQASGIPVIWQHMESHSPGARTQWQEEGWSYGWRTAEFCSQPQAAIRPMFWFQDVVLLPGQIGPFSGLINPSLLHFWYVAP